MRMVGADADEEEEEDMLMMLILVPVEEEEGDGHDGAAEVPFVAKRATRVRSTWGMKVLVPEGVRDGRSLR